MKAQINQLEKDFEDSEDNNEALKAEYEDLKEQLTEKCNETVNRELEERCFSLTSEIDEMCKKLHQTEGIFVRLVFYLAEFSQSQSGYRRTGVREGSTQGRAG